MSKPDHEILRNMREALGLTIREAAEVLETDPTSIRKAELDPALHKTARGVPPRVLQLLAAYAEGFRPPNWPERLREREARMQMLDRRSAP